MSCTLPLPAIVRALTSDIAVMDRRRFGQMKRRRGTLGGKLLVAGTRIPVDAIQRLHHDGASLGEILDVYPDLTERDVGAAWLGGIPTSQARQLRFLIDQNDDRSVTC